MLARMLGAAFKPAISVPLVAALVAGAELAVANRKYGVFTGGFGQSSAVDTGGELAIFMFGFALAHIAVALLAWKLAVRLARASGAQSAVLHFAFLYGGTSLLVLSLRYQLHSYFSDAVSFALLKQLGGGSAADALLFAKNEIMLGVGALLLFGVKQLPMLKMHFSRLELIGTPALSRLFPRQRLERIWKLLSFHDKTKISSVAD